MVYDFAGNKDDVFIEDTEGAIIPDVCPYCGAELSGKDEPTVEFVETVTYEGVVAAGGEARGVAVSGFRELGGMTSRVTERYFFCLVCDEELGVKES